MKIQIKYSCPPDAETLTDLFEAINRFGAIDEGFEPEFICGDTTPEEDDCDCCHLCKEGECQCGDADESDESDDTTKAASFFVSIIEEVVSQTIETKVMPRLYDYINKRLGAEKKRTKIKEAKKKISEDQPANISAAGSRLLRRNSSLKKQNLSRE